ncbi:MAG: hypothetical protein V4505_25860 [Pseudomonadota bacterium]
MPPLSRSTVRDSHPFLEIFLTFLTVCLLGACGGGGSDSETKTSAAPDQISTSVAYGVDAPLMFGITKSRSGLLQTAKQDLTQCPSGDGRLPSDATKRYWFPCFIETGLDWRVVDTPPNVLITAWSQYMGTFMCRSYQHIFNLARVSFCVVPESPKFFGLMFENLSFNPKMYAVVNLIPTLGQTDPISLPFESFIFEPVGAFGSTELGGFNGIDISQARYQLRVGEFLREEPRVLGELRE